MVTLWVLVAIFTVLVILLAIMIYYRFFKRRTTIGMLDKKTRKLQDTDIKLQEERDIRQMNQELEESIVVSKEEIKKLKDKGKGK